MKKADLPGLKIKVSCKNDIAFMDCALLLDKPEFLQLLPNLREKYNISKLLPLSEFPSWMSKMIDEDNQKIDDDITKGITVENLYDLDLRGRKFEMETLQFSRRFKRPDYMANVIRHAIVCGHVDDNSYQHTRIQIDPPYTYYTEEEQPLPEVKIVVTPMTKMSDVKKIFDQNIPEIFEDNKQLLKYYYKMKNTKSENIRRDRDWYWRNVAGEGYTQIALSETSPEIRDEYKKNKSRYIIPEYERVKQAIRRYKNLLRVYIK